ncbi:MAG TPA: zf-TFIIB domain-containing protein [Rhodocyclaceae bacterium]|nr:zf-TFIIB domain-containing protein [Rhodocyclaceae bacterium]
MKDEPFGSEHVQRCVRCSGVFVNGHVLREVRAHSALHLHKNANAASRTKPTKVACPNDSTHMVALNYKGVEIDVCPKCHGVWLDPGELEKISKVVKPPARVDLAKVNSKLEEIEGNIDLIDTVADLDVNGLGDVVGFIGDAISSVFDGISF